MAEDKLKKDEVSEEDKQQLYERVEDLRRSNATLLAETEMFERFISRLDPKDAASLSDSLAGLSPMEAGVGRGRKPKVRMLAQDRMPRLTMEQKCEVAQREQGELRAHLNRRKDSAERVLNNYKATLEEAEIRLMEVKKASYEFERDIVKAMREKKGVTMEVEKIVRYMEDRVKTKDALIEKLRLKSAALQVQKRKLQMQVRQKVEAGESLQEKDFQLLKIKNSQYLKCIDERNQDLLKLKLLSGNTQQILNAHKTKLQDTINESRLLSRDITSRDDMLLKIKAETMMAEKERAEAESLNKELRGQLADFSVPSVMEYITAKTAHSDLEQNVHIWERKVEIAEMTLKNHTKALKQLQVSAAADLGLTH